MTGRLSLATLNAMRGRTRLPRFDPSQLATGIVHLGCGAFHRAHQAMHTQAAIEASGGDWGVVAVSLRGDDVPSRLAPQDGLFAVLERGADGGCVGHVGVSLSKVGQQIYERCTHLRLELAP